jgi:7-keto-8-aminopelargonate synthetase-like enzyme
VRKFVLWGAVAGAVAGVAEAMITAIGATDYWLRVQIHWSQLGFAGWAFGAIGGYVLAKRINRRRAEREARGFCRRCGYDLTGNVSGRCPECGTPTCCGE